jgi:hypothetical protein
VWIQVIYCSGFMPGNKCSIITFFCCRIFSATLVIQLFVRALCLIEIYTDTSSYSTWLFRYSESYSFVHCYFITSKVRIQLSPPSKSYGVLTNENFQASLAESFLADLDELSDSEPCQVSQIYIFIIAKKICAITTFVRY